MKSRLLALVALALFLPGCAVVAPFVQRWELQRAIRQKGSTASNDRHPVLAAFRELGSAAGLEPAKIYVATSRSIHVNAGSVGGGHFMVTEPIITMNNPCLTYGIVAHEIAHEVLGHSDRHVIGATALGAVATAAGMIIPGAGYAVQGAGYLGLSAYSRSNEAEADARAIELLEAVGWPAWTLRYALEFLEDVYGDQGGSWLDTHPATADRIARQKPIDRESVIHRCGTDEARAQHVQSRRMVLAHERARRQPEEDARRGVPPPTPAPESCQGVRQRWTGWECIPAD